MKNHLIQRIGIGWLIDGSGTGIRRNALLEIEDHIIRSVRTADGPIQKNAVDIDLCRCTVWPAMVDSHVHLTWSGTIDADQRAAQLNISYQDAQATIKRHLDRHLACGITAVRDGGDRFGHTLRFKNDPTHRAFQKVHINAAGAAWHAPGRYGRLIGKAPLHADQLPAAINSQALKSDHIKVINSGLNSLTQFGKQTASQFDSETLRQVVAHAHADGLKVMVHANGKAPVKIALEAGCDSIEHGYFMGKENLAAMADKSVTWVPTVVPMQAHAEQLPAGTPEADVARRTLEQQLEQLRLAREYGVPVAAGTDAGSMAVWHGDSLAQEMRLLLTAGFNPAEVVACATFIGASLLGLSGRGKLAAGMSADFVAAIGDPQAVIAQCVRPDKIYLNGIPMQPVPKE